VAEAMHVKQDRSINATIHAVLSHDKDLLQHLIAVDRHKWDETSQKVTTARTVVPVSIMDSAIADVPATELRKRKRKRDPAGETVPVPKRRKRTRRVRGAAENIIAAVLGLGFFLFTSHLHSLTTC
jgi:hypothetical protein